jgi:hypothetical protein
MGARAFFLGDRLNLLAAVAAVALVAASVVAIARQRSTAGVVLMTAGFAVLMSLEYRHIQHSE